MNWMKLCLCIRNLNVHIYLGIHLKMKVLLPYSAKCVYRLKTHVILISWDTNLIDFISLHILEKMRPASFSQVETLYEKTF